MGIEVSSETQPGDILGDYKETVLGMIPKYWNLTKLGDHVEDLIVPMRDKPKQFRGQIPWCRIDDINGKYLCTSKNGYFVDKDTISKMNLKVFPKGTVICSCSANLGICAIAENPLITNQTFIGIVPKNTFDTEFLYYLMISYAKRLQLLSTGTTISYLPKDKFENFIVVKPPLNEQRKIAAILSAVDAAIEQTDAIITQTEQMKKGLMQYVFVTKAAQKKWEITNLSRLAQIEMGQSPPGSTYNEIGDGMALINGPTEFGQSCPKPIQWTTNPTKVCKKGDILFCVRGSSTGRLNSADREYCIGRGVAAIRGKSNKGSTLFIRHYLMHEVPRIYKLAAGGGSTFPNITSTLLNAYPCCSPSLQEQCKIANIFLSIDQRLECENQYRNNLCLIQRGLMRDLLTGRVRVKVDEHA